MKLQPYGFFGSYTLKVYFDLWVIWSILNFGKNVIFSQNSMFFLGHFCMFAVKITECVFSLKSLGLLTPTYSQFRTKFFIDTFPLRPTCQVHLVWFDQHFYFVFLISIDTQIKICCPLSVFLEECENLWNSNQ